MASGGENSNLERLGLIKKQEGKKTFDVVRNRLRLVVENINEAEPNDIAYVYSGYARTTARAHTSRAHARARAHRRLTTAHARTHITRYAPVSVRLVELANSWRQMVDVLNTLPGPSFEQDQQLPEGVLQGTLLPFASLFGSFRFVLWGGGADDSVGPILAQSEVRPGRARCIWCSSSEASPSPRSPPSAGSRSKTVRTTLPARTWRSYATHRTRAHIHAHTTRQSGVHHRHDEAHQRRHPPVESHGEHRSVPPRIVFNHCLIFCFFFAPNMYHLACLCVAQRAQDSSVRA